MADLLFELGLEEVPARMIAAAQAELARRVLDLLTRERLVTGTPQLETFATPRRLAVLVRDVAGRQPDLTEDLLGPAAKIAYKDGIPQPAAIAFARKSGVAVEGLQTVTTPKGEYLQASVTRPGQSAAEVLTAQLPRELAAIYWAKTMYWRAGKPERFVRPVRWILALLDTAVIPIAFGGKQAGRVTFGHRILAGDDPIEIAAPADYAPTLERAFVMADVEARRHRIRKALDHVCRTVPSAEGSPNPRWREDHDLVDTVTHLTEWPSVVLGSFEPEFLTLPEEVLVTVMRDHQKYFAVEDSSHRLLPHFLTVLNTEADTAGQAVIRHGNERVLRARFSDARFFWEFDQRLILRDREVLLENVTFQRDLGSYAQKSARVRTVAAALATICPAVDASAVDEAARLLKTDLTTELVKEFTELQGIVGGLYARAQGVSEAAAAAIYDQYLPASMDDRIPRTPEGQLLGLADRADTIAGMFGLGMEPTGSKDPFALRRAGNSIVKILAEGTLPLTLQQVAEAAAEGRGELVGRMLAFFRERLEFYLREARSQAYDVVAAVLSARSAGSPAASLDVRDAVSRAEALTSVRFATGDNADFAALSAAFKRMRNILEQAREKGIAIPGALDDTALIEPEETALAERSADLAAEVETLRARGNYRAALEAIATLRPQVDAFFDAVMVMVPDEAIRANRLALLSRVLADFSRIADFSEIVVAGG